jgi:hypothetical protein
MPKQDFTPTEIWKSIPDWEGWYSFSNLLRFRRDKPGKGTFAGRILKPVKAHNGYLVVELSRGGKRTYRYIHDIVTEAFLGRRPHGWETDHIDGNKLNNHPSNLQYLPPGENQRKQHTMGLVRTCFGEANGRSKLKAADVVEMRRLQREGVPHRQLARMFHIDKAGVSRICSHKTWQCVP